MAATKLVAVHMVQNGGVITARVATPAATVSTAGTTFAVPAADLMDYDRFVIMMDNLASTDTGTFTARATTIFTGHGQPVYSVVFDSTKPVGSTSAVKYFGPFESAQYRSSQGFRFNLKSNTAGNVCDIIRLEAIMLPNAKSTYGA